VALDVLFAVFTLIANENPTVEACAHPLKLGVVGVERVISARPSTVCKIRVWQESYSRLYEP
jgi:hypothetical protein